MTDRKIKSIAWAVAAACFVAQICLVVAFWGVPQGSDAGEYLRLAERCHAAGAWYPQAEDLYSIYLFAPGLVNFLILQLRLFGTTDLNALFNVLMAAGITCFIFQIAAHYFSKRVAYVAVALWSLLYSNWMVVLPAQTEVPFLFLSLGAYCVVIKRCGWMAFFVAGILLVAANYIRPLSVIFLVPMVLTMLFNREQPMRCAAFAVAVALGVAFLAHDSYRKIGVPAFQSSTSGVNLAMTANDKAYGGVASALLSDTSNLCYIANAGELTFVQKDSVWRARSLGWIKEHPGRFAKLYAMKVGGLFVEDSWADRPILGGAGAIGNYATGHGDAGETPFAALIIVRALKSLVYYVVCVLALAGLVKYRRELLRGWKTKGMLILLFAAGVGSTCLFSVSPRYHYPFMFVIVIWAAWYVAGMRRMGGRSV